MAAGTGLSVEPVAATAATTTTGFTSPVHRVRTLGENGATPVSIHDIAFSPVSKMARTNKLAVFFMDPKTGTQTEYHCSMLRSSKIAPDIVTANPEVYVEGCKPSLFPLSPERIRLRRAAKLEELPGYEVMSFCNMKDREYYLINRLSPRAETIPTAPRYTKDAIVVKRVTVSFPDREEPESLWLVRSVKLDPAMRQSDFIQTPFIPDDIRLQFPPKAEPVKAKPISTAAEPRTWSQWATAMWNSLNCMNATAVEPVAVEAPKTPRKLTSTSVSVDGPAT